MFTAKGYHATRELKKNPTSQFGPGDVLILFGELFSRGYANGLVEEAERRGMRVIRATVGRRDKEGVLQPLSAEEAAQIPQPFINVPLEAGFDLEPVSGSQSLVDLIKDTKLSEWESCKINSDLIESAKTKGRKRFTESVRQFLAELNKVLPEKGNVLFAHLMAGGVPRAKIIMPLMNRSVKGTNERFLSSEQFWKSDLGKLCEQSFQEVTAETFRILMDETSALRQKLEARGNFVSYSAYGYHGTEVLINGSYQWQTYSPYLQGWAKMALENHARHFAKQGVRACVYNCPEILTNSSSIFQGVEVPLYPLLLALKKERPSATQEVEKIWKACAELLKPEFTCDSILKVCHDTLSHPVIREHCTFEAWPAHNSSPQLEILLHASETLSNMHKSPKELMTMVLSEVVFSSCGRAMIEDVASPAAPVTWLNHDLVARAAPFADQ